MLELGLIRDNVDGLAQDDYFRMCLKKTSWYTCNYPCRVGRLVAGGEAADVGALDRYGWYVGAAFQIQDDLLNLVGRYEAYGKEILGDLREGKRTLMLIHLQRALHGPDAGRLQDYLGRRREDRTEDEVRWVLDRMVDHGSLDSARVVAAGLAEAAGREAQHVCGDLPDGPDRDLLLALPRYVVTRER